jgi:hypothetical protein
MGTKDFRNQHQTHTASGARRGTHVVCEARCGLGLAEAICHKQHQGQQQAAAAHDAPVRTPGKGLSEA